MVKLVLNVLILKSVVKGFYINCDFNFYILLNVCKNEDPR